jgi:tRNA-specific 2-thiouridylase
VKFDHLLSRLDEFDCDVLVTGHHARSAEGNGAWSLLRGRDGAKDQSYVLSMLTQRELSRTRFPVGELTKNEVRDVASRLRLRTAAKPESMDICFVGQRDYRGFLADHAPEVFEPGPIVDTSGREIGSHEGIVGFTVGQRRGLGIALGEPRFVIRIEGGTSTVVVGDRDDLGVRKLGLTQLSWVSGRRPASGRVQAQYRAHGATADAGLAGDVLEFTEPQRAISPGQTIAFYDDDLVLGGAIIAGTNL